MNEVTKLNFFIHNRKILLPWYQWNNLSNIKGGGIDAYFSKVVLCLHFLVKKILAKQKLSRYKPRELKNPSCLWICMYIIFFWATIPKKSKFYNKIETAHLLQKIGRNPPFFRIL